jgi:hypothetical protein
MHTDLFSGEPSGAMLNSPNRPAYGGSEVRTTNFAAQPDPHEFVMCLNRLLTIRISIPIAFETGPNY